MDTKHTPGPWSVQSQGTNEHMWILGPEPDNLFVAKLGSAMGFQDANPQETLANARLIAAAPMLLEACKEMHKRHGNEIAGPHETGSRPDICFLCESIAAAEKGE